MENLENELQHLMEIKSGSVRAFAIDNDIPYTTLKSMLSRGVMATNVSNVITICKALNIKPESLGDDKLVFYGDKTIIHGDNHGVNGLSAGGNSTNTYNFGTTKKQDDHNESIRNLSAADVKLQRQILNRFDKQLTVQEETNKLLRMLIDIQEETLDELKLITAPIRKENLKNK